LLIKVHLSSKSGAKIDIIFGLCKFIFTLDFHLSKKMRNFATLKYNFFTDDIGNNHNTLFATAACVRVRLVGFKNQNPVGNTALAAWLATQSNQHIQCT
jgi:hypothetical protein